MTPSFNDCQNMLCRISYTHCCIWQLWGPFPDSVMQVTKLASNAKQHSILWKSLLVSSIQLDVNFSIRIWKYAFTVVHLFIYLFIYLLAAKSWLLVDSYEMTKLMTLHHSYCRDKVNQLVFNNNKIFYSRLFIICSLVSYC